MAARQAVLRTVVSMDVKSRESIHALELFEAVQWHLGCARDELEQLGAFFFVERSNGAPEPLDLRGRRCVIVVVGVVLPVVDVDVRETGNEELEFLFIEDSDQFGGNNVVEAWMRGQLWRWI
jgi:hypothetical protein